MQTKIFVQKLPFSDAAYILEFPILRGISHAFYSDVMSHGKVDIYRFTSADIDASMKSDIYSTYRSADISVGLYLLYIVGALP